MRTTTDAPHLITTPAQLAAMRRAGALVAAAHRAVRAAIAPGVATRDLADLAEATIRAGGGRPAFLGYGRPPFPGAICASPNAAVVHGIPNRRKLADGDLIAIDIGAEVDGHYGDSAWSYGVGDVDAAGRRLLAAGEAALAAGIAAARAGNRVGAIGAAVEDAVAPTGFAVVAEYGGHGIGRVLHGWPHVANVRLPDPGPLLRVGQGLAIEPILAELGPDVRTKGDAWTVVTRDGGRSVHFEHTLVITEDGPEILT